jgi:uncharacterized membrane protein
MRLAAVWLLGAMAGFRSQVQIEALVLNVPYGMRPGWGRKE